MKFLYLGSAWSTLGFIRGTQYYEYLKSIYNEPFSYSNYMFHGIQGSMVYIHPCTIGYVLHKEMYRLHVNIQKLECEKHTFYYKELI
jgi:hypothetical protein